MSRVSMTVRQICDLGLWSEVCEQESLNPWAINEGLISDDDTIEFDSGLLSEECYMDVKDDKQLIDYIIEKLNTRNDECKYCVDRLDFIKSDIEFILEKVDEYHNKKGIN
jgi:hypothetical protein